MVPFRHLRIGKIGTIGVTARRFAAGRTCASLRRTRGNLESDPITRPGRCFYFNLATIVTDHRHPSAPLGLAALSNHHQRCSAAQTGCGAARTKPITNSWGPCDATANLLRCNRV